MHPLPLWQQQWLDLVVRLEHGTVLNTDACPRCEFTMFRWLLPA